MQDLATKLNRKVELWGMTDQENALGETERVKGKLKNIWCKITPLNGGSAMLGGTAMEEATVRQKIICRKQSIGNPSIDMFFVDGNGWKYYFKHFYPSYKENNFWEIITEIKYE